MSLGKEFKTNSKEVPSDFILCCYQQSNLFLMTSLIESFGIVLVEAMAANLPIITSNVDGCKDVIRNGNDGLIFKKNDLSDLTHKIKLIVENKKIYNLLAASGIVYPFYRTFFPGYGADYHYFGSVPFNNKGKLAVNNNCQLLSSKNIYIIDGSVFNFRSNRYPLGIIAANARRVAKYLSK